MDIIADIVKCDFKELEKFKKDLQGLKTGRREFAESSVKEFAARLLAKVVPRTPVGNYSRKVQLTAKRGSKSQKKGDAYTKRVKHSGRNGGTIRRG